jgi:hypothetical protein
LKAWETEWKRAVSFHFHQLPKEIRAAVSFAAEFFLARVYLVIDLDG